MKRYSTNYPLIFGILMLVGGIVIGQIALGLVFGGLFIGIAVWLKQDEKKEKEAPQDTCGKGLNVQNQTLNGKKFVCARCKCEITEEESVWIGNHRFCSICALPSNQTPRFPTAGQYKFESPPVPGKVKVAQAEPSVSAGKYTCARCRCEITEEESVWVDGRRLCLICSLPSNESRGEGQR